MVEIFEALQHREGRRAMTNGRTDGQVEKSIMRKNVKSLKAKGHCLPF